VPPSKHRRRLALAALLLALGGAILWAVLPPRVPPPWVPQYDVSARPLELLPPGTVVGDGPPPGWSHLVIKSLPRVRPEHRSSVDALTARMTSWLFTAFVADVTRDRPHRLREVAVGLGTEVNGKHTVLDVESAKRHGVELNWITREILTKALEAQAMARVVVHGPTMGLVDTAVWFRCGVSNRLIRLRYALLVDPETGRLDVLMWALAPPDCRDPHEAAWLSHSQIDPAGLVPDKTQFSLVGIPSEAAFGIDRLPAHRAKVRLPDELMPLATRMTFTPEEARELEAGVRQVPWE
jgi:hypothetical protein